MKSQYRDLINRASKILDSHNEMNTAAIEQEHDELKLKFDVAEAELIEREDECDTDSEDLSEALKAIMKVSDVRAYHSGFSVTQL